MSEVIQFPPRRSRRQGAIERLAKIRGGWSVDDFERWLDAAWAETIAHRGDDRQAYLLALDRFESIDAEMREKYGEPPDEEEEDEQAWW